MHNIDREMLELAAFAVGIVGEWVEDSNLDDYYKLPTTGILTRSEGRTRIWNAETSSGDAFRLAVELRLDIMGSMTTGNIRYVRNSPDTCAILDVDSCAATRCAIVRVASEIGRKMKETAKV